MESKYRVNDFPPPSVCEHVSRLIEYLGSQKLTMFPHIKDRRTASVYCRQCARSSSVSLPLVDDVVETPKAT